MVRGKRATSLAAVETALETNESETVTTNEDRNGQLRVPGMERKTSPAIEAQALRVYELQMERIEAAKAENAERKALTKMMREMDIPEQDLPDDLVVELDTEPKAKVHKRKNKKASDEADDRAEPNEDPDDEAATE